MRIRYLYTKIFHETTDKMIIFLKSETACNINHSKKTFQLLPTTIWADLRPWEEKLI